MAEKLRMYCVIAATNANGSPDFCSVTVLCTQEEYDCGDHYETAKDWAESGGYEHPMVVFDQNDGPKFLHDKMHELYPNDNDICEVGDTFDEDEDEDTD